MSGKGFASLDDIESQLDGKAVPSTEENQEVAQGTDLSDLVAIMTDRTNAIGAGHKDEVSILRDDAMSGLVQRLMTVTVAEQELLGYAIALNNGKPIPEHLPANEREHIRQAALILKMGHQGRALTTFKARPSAAIAGLRNVPALNPHSN